MGKFEKLIVRLLAGGSDKNFDFSDLLKIVIELGFDLRISGSHHILTRPEIPEIINIQPKGKLAKPYQVKQVRELIINYKLWDNEENTDEHENQQ